MPVNHTTKKWIDYFMVNAHCKRIDWNLKPSITEQEIATILASLQAWQLGETSDGRNLIRAATKHALQIGDPDYVQAVRLFIKEEQKHGENLGRYLDAIGQKRIEKDWGDTLFRRVRHLNTSMESWTLAVLVVESAAQIFYQSLKDATGCMLLKEICTDILIDEARHIRFQKERMAIIFGRKTPIVKWISREFYKLFFFAVTILIWVTHRRLFRAGGNSFTKYMKKMRSKCRKTIPAHAGDHRASQGAAIQILNFSPGWTRQP